MTPIEKSIIATLIYYNQQDFPLTVFELWRLCVPSPRLDPGAKKTEVTFNEIRESLSVLQRENFIEEKNGFFTLAGRTEIYKSRIENKKISDQKWKKTLKALKWLQAVPYLRAIFASGSLASENTSKDSDLDVLVVAKYGRIWTCRFFIFILTSILGVRRKKYDKIAPDKVCLNHYITDKSLSILFRSLYNAQTYAHLIPIWRADGKILSEFEKENRWIGEFVNVWKINSKRKHRTVKESKFLKAVSALFEKALDSRLGSLIESLMRRMQRGRIVKSKQYQKRGGRITVEDGQLEFHPDSPEKGIIERYNRGLAKYGISTILEKDSGLF